MWWRSILEYFMTVVIIIIDKLINAVKWLKKYSKYQCLWSLWSTLPVFLNVLSFISFNEK